MKKAIFIILAVVCFAAADAQTKDTISGLLAVVKMQTSTQQYNRNQAVLLDGYAVLDSMRNVYLDKRKMPLTGYRILYFNAGIHVRNQSEK